MAFADDLLKQAQFLANREPRNPKQASLRRAVSTAYYALFHLLIDEAVGNWSIARQRSILARTFDHAKMKSVCEAHVTSFYNAGSPPVGLQLKNVAQTFGILQQQRHIADYDNGFQWLRTNAVAQIDLASAAFMDWRVSAAPSMPRITCWRCSSRSRRESDVVCGLCRTPGGDERCRKQRSG